MMALAVGAALITGVALLTVSLAMLLVTEPKELETATR